MGILLTKILTVLALPPGINLLAALAGALSLRRWPLLGRTLIVLSLVGLYAASMPVVSRNLDLGLEAYGPLDPSTVPDPAQWTIVVLAAGRIPFAPEYGGPTVPATALARMRYAAVLHRRLGSPVLIAGGSVYGEAVAESQLMAGVMREEFGVPVRWLDTRGRNTAESARYSARILGGANRSRVILVTDSTHMPRSVEAFEREGLEVIPAPTGFTYRPGAVSYLFDWLPRADALSGTASALHEYLGRAWYRLRY